MDSRRLLLLKLLDNFSMAQLKACLGAFTELATESLYELYLAHIVVEADGAGAHLSKGRASRAHLHLRLMNGLIGAGELRVFLLELIQQLSDMPEVRLGFELLGLGGDDLIILAL